MVAEQLSLAPAQGAVVVLLRVTDDALEPVAMGASDDVGAFTLTAPEPGVYRVQAELGGLTSPLSPTLALEETDAVAEVALLLPSALLQAALQCRAEAGEETAAVVGVIRDRESGVSLPGIAVNATWQEGRRVRRIEVESDGSGQYRVCGLPSDAGRVGFEALLLGMWRPQGQMEITAPAVVFHDMALSPASSVGPALGIEKDVLQEHILLEAAARTLGDLRGQVLDQHTGTPVPYVVVRLAGTPYQALGEEDGRFAFEGLTPGLYIPEIRGLGYQVTAEAVELPAGKDVFLTLRVAPQAVELEGLEVTTRSAVEEITRLTPFRRDITYGEVMAAEEERGARAYETLRRTAPGLRVTEVWREMGPPTLCVQTNRRIQRLTPQDAIRPTDVGLLEEGPSQCDNVQVVVDGMKIPDGPQFLLRTPASEIESIEFISPVHAQILYGIGGNTSNGVVVVYTRGKGPYASPLRNLRAR